MSSVYGENIKVSIWGQSHSPAIGVTIDGLPAGIEIDISRLQQFLDRRAPGKNRFSTARSEGDAPEFLSGLKDGFTCGAPLTAVIRNSDARPSDYEELKSKPRPSHADYTAQVKYGGFQDASGGGHFSGRLTAPLCIAGGICLQILERQGITISASVKSIVGQTEPGRMTAAVDKARARGDSVGGIIECVALNIPAGIGDPMFDGMENRISKAVFAIPAVKGIEFGNGFSCALLFGSENNDAFYTDNGEIKTKTNNHGGILGGITSGMPVVFRVAVKPTPSIGIRQETVNMKTGENTDIAIPGRHDPCIVFRALPCVEAAAALAVYDAILERKKEI
jgi:chorismate synthase